MNLCLRVTCKADIRPSNAVQFLYQIFSKISFTQYFYQEQTVLFY